jgi:hypothetical protein
MQDILVRFQPNVGFCLHIFVKVRKVKFTDIRPLGAALMHGDVQADRRNRNDEDNSRFSGVSEAL